MADKDLLVIKKSMRSEKVMKMTTCEKCGRVVPYEESEVWQITARGRTETRHFCERCANLIHMYSEPAYLPGQPNRSRLDAYIESLEREAKRKPKDQIKKFVKDLLKEGWGFKKIGEELGIGMDSALLIGAEIKENTEGMQ